MGRGKKGLKLRKRVVVHDLLLNSNAEETARWSGRYSVVHFLGGPKTVSLSLLKFRTKKKPGNEKVQYKI
jgi:hypothetical protein